MHMLLHSLSVPVSLRSAHPHGQKSPPQIGAARVHAHQAEMALARPPSSRIQVQLAHRLAGAEGEPVLSQQVAVPPLETPQSAVGEQRPEAVAHREEEVLLLGGSMPPPLFAPTPAESPPRREALPLHHVFAVPPLPLRECIAGRHFGSDTQLLLP